MARAAVPEFLAREPDRFAFLVMKPDAVVQGLQTEILDFLEDYGFHIVAAKQAMLTPAHRADLYVDFLKGARTNWDLGSTLYSLGPSNFVILHDDRPVPDATAAERLTRVKGNFIPRLAGNDTIRGRFNAVSPVFNLVHTSDDTTSMLREVPIFFRPGELAAGERIERPAFVGVRGRPPFDPIDDFYSIRIELLAAERGGDDLLECLIRNRELLRQAGGHQAITWPIFVGALREEVEKVAETNPAPTSIIHSSLHPASLSLDAIDNIVSCWATARGDAFRCDMMRTWLYYFGME